MEGAGGYGPGGEGRDRAGWQQHVFFLHDSSFVKSERDPPEQAIVCFIAPVQVETTTQAFTCGGLIGIVNFALALTGGSSPLVFQMKSAKVAHKKFGTYSLCLAGSRLEPDASLVKQLECIIAAFEFYHGSFDRVKLASNYDRKRFCNTMTRIFSGLLSYFRPPSDRLQAGFCPTPVVDLPKSMNRHFSVSSQILDNALHAPGVLGGCILHRQRVICTQLPLPVTNWILAIVQPTQSTNYLDEDNRRLRRRGLKIKELMSNSPRRLIRSREYRLRTYPSCFVGSEFVSFLLEKDEVRSREAAVALGRRLLQLGVIQHVVNESDFRDDVKYYRFFGDQASAKGPSRFTAKGDGTKAPRPLMLVGHGRDARAALKLRGIHLHEGVHVIPAFIRPELLGDLQRQTPWFVATPPASATRRRRPGDRDRAAGPAEGAGANSVFPRTGFEAVGPASPDSSPVPERADQAADAPSSSPAPEQADTSPAPVSEQADQAAAPEGDIDAAPSVEEAAVVAAGQAAEDASDQLPFPEVAVNANVETPQLEASTGGGDALASAAVEPTTEESEAAPDAASEPQGKADPVGPQLDAVPSDADAVAAAPADPGQSAPSDPSPAGPEPAPPSTVPTPAAEPEPAAEDEPVDPFAASDGSVFASEAAEQAAMFQEFVDGRGFGPYRWLLDSLHISSKASLKATFSKLTITAIDDLLQGRPNVDTHAFFALLHAVGVIPKGEGTRELLNSVRGLHPIRLYLQGLGDTVLALLVEEEHGEDQSFLDAMAGEVHTQLVELEDTIAACHREEDRLVQASKAAVPSFVDEYNSLSYTHRTRSLSGWCNTNWPAKTQRLVPDSDIDHSFVESVVDMHDAFNTTSRFPPVSEMILRKNYNPGVYGKRTFGQETFFQLRQPLSGKQGRNNLRPFDDNISQLQKTVRKRLASEQDVSYL